MAGKGGRWIWAAILVLAALLTAAPALAADEELEKQLPGEWIYSAYTGEGEETADRAILTLGEDGSLQLKCDRPDGTYAYTCGGSWSFEFVPDFNDRLILRFTSTDDPSKAGEDYRTECAFEAYAESWVETDTQVTYLILTPVEGWGVAPFADIYDEWEVALHREQGPNMRVVNCSSYVSLRQKPSKSSARLKKVPLGASVLAFPEYGEENGFTCCVYGGEYGWILSEYLEEAE